MNDSLLSNMTKAEERDPLPNDWRDVSLADVADIRVSNVDKKSALGEVPVRLCNYIDVYNNEYITASLDFMEATATPSELARFSVEVGDVMITKDSETPDDIGVPAVAVWSDPRLVCGYHLALFKPDRDQVNPVFLAKQLGLPRIAAYYGRLACGSTRYGMSNSGIARTPLRLPPVNQQRKIARILTTLDNLIEKTESLIAKYQAIKQGMMHDLFTRGVDAHGHLRPTQAEDPNPYKQSELGWIPKEWESKALKFVAVVQYGIGDPLDRALKEGVNILSLPNVSITGEFVLNDVPKVERRKVAASGFLCEGDLLFNWRNGSREHLGKTAYFDLAGEWTHVGFLLKVAADRSQCDPRFLFYEFTYRRATGFFLTSKSQVNNTFNASELEAMVVRVPASLGEQEAIASRLSSLDSQMVAERIYLKNLAVLKSGLTQDLLTGKVRVKVDEAEEVAADG